MKTKLRIDEELRCFIPPLTEAEREALTRSLRETGRATDPLTVWRGTILDGHNRFEICTELGLPFDVIDLGDALADRDAAKRWIFEHQIARRNLSRDQIVALALLRGVRPSDVWLAKTCDEARPLLDDARGRELLEEVLRGDARRTIRVAINSWRLRHGERGATGARRTRLQIARDAVSRLNKADLRALAVELAERLEGDA